MYGASGSSRLLTPSQCTTGTPIWVRENLMACLLEPPQPAGQAGQPAAVVRRLGVEHVDDEHAEAALTQVAQRLDEPRVQQRAEDHDQRTRRQGGSRQPRQAVGSLPAARGGHHEIQQPLIVPLPLAGADPAQAAGENDQADPVARGQVRA